MGILTSARPCFHCFPPNGGRAAMVAGTNRQYLSDLEKIEKEAPQVYAKIEARRA